MERINGTPVTDEMIQKWAEEAEHGYDPEQVRKRGRKPLGTGGTRIVPVRIDAALLAAVDERAAREHLTRSGAIRAALYSYTA
ncbi:ribbon-helix-helix domain-containing protein [Arthrobacter sp. UM1]|uniref:ribbon-helix-helix domain-containing protein n=1 Tax=Arthrobacter sp. UM1 TaxID=2766776 RepID=UPI001CF63EE8|nr:ribbon-helix-helix domain-containing protein [Arthrobacter sp. UM1]